MVSHDSLEAGVQRVLAAGEVVCVLQCVCVAVRVYGLPGEVECEDSTSRDSNSTSRDSNSASRDDSSSFSCSLRQEYLVSSEHLLLSSSLSSCAASCQCGFDYFSVCTCTRTCT